MEGLSWVRMREKQEEGTKFGEEKLSKSSFFVSEREKGRGEGTWLGSDEVK